MRLERLDIRGYGRLRGNYDFAAGLTLVTGPNEAGKSTLHDAIVHALFGFSPEERRRHDGSSPKDERIPWTGSPFGVTLRAHDCDGLAVLVSWDFQDDLADLRDAVTGESLLHEQPKQRTDHELGQRLVGMRREEFIQVCCLFQEALSTVRPSEELRAALQRSLESAPAEEIGVQSADERLRKLLSSLGVHGGHYGETQGGALQRLTVREGALEQELAQAREQRAELDGVAADLGGARASEERLAQRAVALEQAALRARVVELEGGEQSLATAREEVDQEIAGQDGLLAQLDSRIEALSRYAGVDLSGEEEVRQLLADVRGLAGEPDADPQPTPNEESAPQPQRDPALARFRQRRDELIVLQAGAGVRRWNVGLLIAAAVLAGMGVIGGAVVHPVLAALLLPALACAFAARPRSPGAEVDLSSLADFDDRSFDDLEASARSEDQRLMTFQASLEERERVSRRHTERLDALQGRLAVAVGPHEGDGEDGDLSQRAEAYLRRCARSRELADALAEQQRLTTDLAALRELKAVCGRLREHEKLHGPQEEIAGEPASLGAEHGRVSTELRDLELRITELRTVLDQREQRLSDPAEREVELAEVCAQREQVELKRDAIRIARDGLRQAAHDTHRRVAPHLNEALRRELPRITRGRYAEGTVDEDLAIKLYAPESGNLVSIERLSRGTRDQVALVQRLEIACLLDPTAGSAPLLLDDPFSHFDAQRLRLGAELITEVAERRQVILFTEDIAVIARMQESCPSCSLIELPDPVDQEFTPGLPPADSDMAVSS
jgi:ABC-type dipeptide/oligopeptide/nickel transport system ATPase subunit